MLKLAIIGTGAMGKKYALMLRDSKTLPITLQSMVCRSVENKKWAEDNFSNVAIYPSVDELFSHADTFDAVLIVTPHKTHPELTKMALSHNKHVLCDKPYGVLTSDVEEINSLAAKANKKFAMMFHQRLYDKYIYIKKMLDKNELGDLKRVSLFNSRYFRTSFYHNSSQWRSSWAGEGGGALINQGQHLLDIWQWLFKMPESIYANIGFGKYNDFNVDDEATLSLKYKNNMTGVFVLSTGEAVSEERLEIVGAKGKLLLEDNTLHIYTYNLDSDTYLKTATFNSREGLDISHMTIDFEKKPEPYIEMFQNFADSILYNKPLVAEGYQGANSLTLTNAAYLSAWLDKPITLPLDNNLYKEELERMINDHE